LARIPGGSYLRLAREKSPLVTTDKTPFDLGKAQIYRSGRDVTIIACGTMVYQSLVAAEQLSKKGIDAEVINLAVVKPLDAETIVHSVKKTGAVVTVEEAQAAGGMGSAVAELLSERLPVPVRRIGIMDRFGESGDPNQLLEYFGLTAPHIAEHAASLIKKR
jgi:transketolase